MAKRGAGQQLQADIQTDEELEEFIDRPGLLVLEVYSDWCGPCLGMVGTLKKIKLEIGGDNLHLAICNAEYVTALQRFGRKSEPTWLFVTNGKAVNIQFGTSVPKLTETISKELKYLDKRDRPSYDIHEYQPIEIEMKKLKEEAEAEAIRLEAEAKENKRDEYFTFVTDTIMDALPDIGVTLFGPQVNRDMFKKISEAGDPYKIQCKDRKMTTVTKENFDVINYKCPNPLPEDVIEQLVGRDLLICFWKVPGIGNDVPSILKKYADGLTAPRPSHDGDDEPQPPIFSPMEIHVELELDDNYTDDEEGDDELEADEAANQNIQNAISDEPDTGLPADDEVEEEDEEGSVDFDKSGPKQNGSGLGLDERLDEEEEEESDEFGHKKYTRRKIVTIPPIWTPENQRTHAALIYVFFRNATTTFLPPDPVPETPHIIMSYETYKRKDLLAHASRNKKDVIAYGFFTSDDPDEATLIANSEAKYVTKPHSPSDKLVFKVNKTTSNTMLSLVTYGPSYVSPNTIVGYEEAKKFFPETYMSAEEEYAEQLKLQEAEKNNAKSGKKGKPEEGDKAYATTLNAESGQGNENRLNVEDEQPEADKIGEVDENHKDNGKKGNGEGELEDKPEHTPGVTFADSVGL